MNRSTTIDKLFRKKLERRSFPLEDQQLDDVRALIDLHNATRTDRWAISWKWIGAALIPLAALLWWTFGTTTEPVASLKDATSAGTMHGPELAAAADIGPGPVAQHASATTTTEHISEPAVQPVPTGSSVTAVLHSTSDPRGVRTNGPDGSTLPQGSITVHPKKRTEQRIDQITLATGTTTMPDASNGQDHLTATAFDMGHAWTTTRMEPLDAALLDRNVNADQASLRYEVMDPSALRDRALGELHFFGAPMSTRSLPQMQGPAARGNGSLFGFEYRVKAKALSGATGIHYGTYAFNMPSTVDTAACNVRLEYVEVPLLAGYEVGFGRLGVMMQGGVSCNFYFNGTGRYGARPEQGGSLIADEHFRTVNFALLLRPLCTYRITEQLGIAAGPVWSRQLSGIALDGPLTGARAQSFGASVGITWRLERSTF